MMNFPANPRSARSYGQMFLVLGHVVAASFALLLLSATGVLPEDLSMIGGTFAVLGLMAMFTMRNSDEWIATLWSAGANAGFAAAIAWMILVPAIEGFVDGFSEALTEAPAQQDITADAASFAAIGAFLIAFYIKRIRGV